MKYIIITGSSGLVGSETVSFFHQKGFKVIGIDNNLRKYFFGKIACTNWKKKFQIRNLKNFNYYNIDIRNYNKLEKLFLKYKTKVKCIIHTAAQPSHDWAVKDPNTDFTVNAFSTLNLLELTKKYCPKAVFIFVSTNKVYGDTPNRLKFNEKSTRFEIKKNNKFYNGIDETMSIDQSTHSLFGVSKSYADLITQEYGRNFGLNTGIFRLGCITGGSHSGAELHGFLSYLVRANLKKIPYVIYGYNGKQVRDNIHALDLVKCFWEFYKKPKKGEVYNIGGGRDNSCSVLEAMHKIEEKTKIKFNFKIIQKNRVGDHIWYISNNKKFKKDYKNWKVKISLSSIIDDIKNNNANFKYPPKF
jgi:CDP-paratose 2-epimerase